MAQLATIVEQLIRLLQPQLANQLSDADFAQLPALNAQTDLLGDLALESVQVMEYIVEIEDHYDIAIDLESLSQVRTLAEMADVVVRQLEA